MNTTLSKSREVVNRIRGSLDSVSLLLVVPKTDGYFRKKAVTITTQKNFSTKKLEKSEKEKLSRKISLILNQDTADWSKLTEKITVSTWSLTTTELDKLSAGWTVVVLRIVLVLESATE